LEVGAGTIERSSELMFVAESFRCLYVFFIFLWYWGLNWGPCAC
jgi:hypothetical protein